MKKSVIIKLTAIFLAFALLGGMKPVISEDFDKYGLIINDSFINKEITATALEGITYVPLGKINDLLEIKIAQQDETIVLSRQKLSLVLKLLQAKAYIETNGQLGESYAYQKDGTLYVPVLFLADYMGLNIEVLKDIKFIRITTKPDVQFTGQLYESYFNAGVADKKVTLPATTGKTGPKVAYLTFDDGLDSKVTPQVLDILKKYNIKGTFFIIGNTISRNKNVLKRIVDEGHIVGNHTYTHKKSIIYTNVKNFSEELAKTSKAIYDAVGITPKYFRPPYGAPYIRSQEYKDALSQYKVILWNVDSMDSRIKGISGSEIAAAVKRQVKNKNNVIILFHNTGARQETVKALPEVIEYLIQNGYTISNLE